MNEKLLPTTVCSCGTCPYIEETIGRDRYYCKLFFHSVWSLSEISNKCKLPNVVIKKNDK